jgi:hypothetical protein
MKEEAYITVGDWTKVSKKFNELIEVYGKISAEQTALLNEHHQRLCRLEKLFELLMLDIKEGLAIKE